MKNIYALLIGFAMVSTATAHAAPATTVWCQNAYDVSSGAPGGNLYVHDDGTATVWVRTLTNGLQEQSIEFPSGTVEKNGNSYSGTLPSGESFTLTPVRRANGNAILKITAPKQNAKIGAPATFSVAQGCGGI